LNLTIDWATLVNWIISGLVGFIFGVIGTTLQHRLDRKRDDLAWQRKLEELQRQWEHENEVRLKELLRQQEEKASERIRAELTTGLDTFTQATAERITIHSERYEIRRLPQDVEQWLRQYVTKEYNNLDVEQQVMMYQTLGQALEFMSQEQLEGLNQEKLERLLTDLSSKNSRNRIADKPEDKPLLKDKDAGENH
jgi:hypothetical protein